jgi:hypothetical protein
MSPTMPHDVLQMNSFLFIVHSMTLLCCRLGDYRQTRFVSVLQVLFSFK